jgi:hypothetical protein
MSRRIRSSSVVTRVFALLAFCVATEHAAVAALNDCSQPVTNGLRPTATDCLFILKAAVGAETCNPECICAPKGTLPITATDALVCLKYAVGQPVGLNCPCANTTTTLPPTTTITPPSTTIPTITTTSTTSTTVLGGPTTTTIPPVADYGCAIESASCLTDACTCAGVLDGLDYHLGGYGSMHGPVGTQLRVNTELQFGGVIACGNWHQIDATVNPSCDTIGCCERQAGDPESSHWGVDEVYNFPCFCPELPGASANLLIQCQPPGGLTQEHEQTTTPCQ